MVINDQQAIYVNFNNYICSAKSAVANSNLKLITDILCSDRILRDPRIFSGCLKLLKNTQSDKNNKSNKATYVFIKRYDDKDVINAVIENFKKFFFYPKLDHFEPIASEVIDFLYRMCEAPDILCQVCYAYHFIPFQSMLFILFMLFLGYHTCTVHEVK